MSEVQSKDGRPAAKAEADEPNPVVSMEVDPEESPNERLLKESKKWKEKFQGAAKELEALRLEKEERARQEQEEQGRYRELYEKTRSDLEKERGAVREERRNSQIRVKAQEMGCKDVDAALRLGDMQLLQYDDDSRAYHGVDAFLEQLKESRPYLFEIRSTPTINPKVPGGKPVNTPVDWRSRVKSTDAFREMLGAKMRK